MKTERTKTIEKTKKRPGRSGYIAEIVVNLIILYVANMLLAWNVPYLTSEWTAALWILNISIVVTVGSNVLFLVYDPNWFRSLFKMIIGIVSILFLLTFLYVYPLDFSSLSYGGTIDLVIKIITIIGLVGTGISVIVYFFKMFSQD